MTACESHESLLQAYIDQELTAEERGEVEGHLGGCATCAEAVEDLLKLRNEFDFGLHLERVFPPDSGRTDQLYGRLHALLESGRGTSAVRGSRKSALRSAPTCTGASNRALRGVVSAWWRKCTAEGCRVRFSSLPAPETMSRNSSTAR